MANRVTIRDLADRVGAELEGEGAGEVGAAAPLESAGPGDVSFLARRKYLPYLGGTRASAVLVSRELEELGDVPAGTALLWVDDAHLALAEALELLYPTSTHPSGIASSAVLGSGVELGDHVTIGEYAVVGPGARLGDGVRIGAHVVIGEACRVGEGTEIRPHVTLYPGTTVGERCIIHSGARLGSDGYGYVHESGRHRKVPQVGRCVIEDDVEIGANTTIDRGSIGETRIGAGTKIDNLVQIGHNVRVGRGCLIVSQVGIAGSSTLGDGVALAGQVGIIGHLRIGDGAQVAAQSGVSADIPAGATYFGSPARPIGRAMRANAVFLKLPDLWRRLRRLESRLGTDDSE